MPGSEWLVHLYSKYFRINITGVYLERSRKVKQKRQNGTHAIVSVSPLNPLLVLVENNCNFVTIHEKARFHWAVRLQKVY